MIAKILRATVVVLFLALLVACAVAPGTGRTIFTGGLSEEDEKALGYEQHPKMLDAFGGIYDDPELNEYITSVGDLLAENSELANLEFTFTVLDSPIVNAFALPGGYVYVSRGLLTLARNEAEVASVLAHEIGHVTARHSAERYGQGVIANIATVGVGILAGGAAADLSQTVGSVALKSYSRDQEFEADTLGIRYLARAGYDTGSSADFLRQLQAHSRLEAELAGNPEAADSFNIMQTHPRTVDRIKKAAKNGKITPVANPKVGEELYLRMIDGVVYGDNPDQGVIKGREFLHPALRFSFEVPKGFRLNNAPTHVLAQGPDGSVIFFDRAPESFGGPMTRYLRDVWAKTDLNELQAIEINGMKAATGWLRSSGRSGNLILRGVAIQYDKDTVYRFLFAAPEGQHDRYSVPFRRTTYSFHKLSSKEAARIKPVRIRLHEVQPGESAADIAARMPFEELKLKRLLVLNGLTDPSQVRAGDVLKVVSTK